MEIKEIIRKRKFILSGKDFNFDIGVLYDKDNKQFNIKIGIEDSGLYGIQEINAMKELLEKLNDGKEFEKEKNEDYELFD